MPEQQTPNDTRPRLQIVWTDLWIKGADGRPDQLETAAVEGGRPVLLDELLSQACADDAPLLKALEEPVDGAALLQGYVDNLRRFVVLDEDQAVIAALWMVYAHAYRAWSVSPILSVQSPEKGCGKTTMLCVIQALTPNALTTSNISPAALFGVIAKLAPTLIVDEGDTFLRGNKDVLNILNSGYTSTLAFVHRAHRDGVKTSGTFCPKVVASIGPLPSTLQDRSLVIGLRRKLPDEDVEPLLSEHMATLSELQHRAARWGAENFSTLENAKPAIPAAFVNRAADNVRPLLAVADVIGGAWSECARAAICRLLGAADDAEGDAIKLLSDIQAFFNENGADKVASKDLAHWLTGLEERGWATYRQRRPITVHDIARLLHPFGIHPGNLRLGAQVRKGYTRADFIDAFARYLPAAATPLSTLPEEPVTPRQDLPLGAATPLPNLPEEPVAPRQDLPLGAATPLQTCLGETATPGSDDAGDGVASAPGELADAERSGVAVPRADSDTDVGTAAADPAAPKVKGLRWVDRGLKHLSALFLPEPMKRELQAMTARSMPNLLLSGPPGTGKTTTAKALVTELGLDCYSVNGSLDVTMDFLRDDLRPFASGASLTGGRKAIHIEEADLNRSVQLAMRGFMDDYGQHVVFIFTCNQKDKIEDAIRSRCREFDFDFAGPSRESVEAQVHAYVRAFLTKGGVRYDEERVRAVIKEHYPDIRKILIELEGLYMRGELA